MTLDELPALLPDNNTGAIDAADLRTIVTELWTQGDAIAARVSALENAAGGGTQSVAGHWQIAAPGSVPGGAQVSGSSSDWSAITWLRFARFDKSNEDFLHILTGAEIIYGQQTQNAENWARYQVMGPGTLTGSYVEIAVSYMEGGGTPGSAAWQDGTFVFIRSV